MLVALGIKTLILKGTSCVFSVLNHLFKLKHLNSCQLSGQHKERSLNALKTASPINITKSFNTNYAVLKLIASFAGFMLLTKSFPPPSRLEEDKNFSTNCSISLNLVSNFSGTTNMCSPANTSHRQRCTYALRNAIWYTL